MLKYYVGYEDGDTKNNPQVFEAKDIEDAKEYGYEQIFGPFDTEDEALDSTEENGDYCDGCKHLGETTCANAFKGCWQAR